MNYTKFLGAASAALLIITVIFTLTPGAWAQSKYKTLYTFSGGADGYSPQASLIFDQAGNLYGTTTYGGSGYGTVFELTPNADGSWTESVLHSFDGSDGTYAADGLVFDQKGNLYGATVFGSAYGGGNVFELIPNADGSWKETVLHRFAGGEDGGIPWAGLILDAAGNLYGTANSGGNLKQCGGQGCGVVFKLVPQSNGGWHETVLHVFGDHPGAEPQARLLFDAAGNLYGTTNGDRSTTFGSVFEITP